MKVLNKSVIHVKKKLVISWMRQMTGPLWRSDSACRRSRIWCVRSLARRRKRPCSTWLDLARLVTYDFLLCQNREREWQNIRICESSKIHGLCDITIYNRSVLAPLRMNSETFHIAILWKHASQMLPTPRARAPRPPLDERTRAKSSCNMCWALNSSMIKKRL
jgi:hypothetical protein